MSFAPEYPKLPFAAREAVTNSFGGSLKFAINRIALANSG